MSCSRTGAHSSSPMIRAAPECDDDDDGFDVPISVPALLMLLLKLALLFMLDIIRLRFDRDCWSVVADVVVVSVSVVSAPFWS